MKLEKLIKIKLWWIKFEKKPIKNAKNKNKKREKGPYAWFG